MINKEIATAMIKEFLVNMPFLSKLVGQLFWRQKIIIAKGDYCQCIGIFHQVGKKKSFLTKGIFGEGGSILFLTCGEYKRGRILIFDS